MTKPQNTSDEPEAAEGDAAEAAPAPPPKPTKNPRAPWVGPAMAAGFLFLAGGIGYVLWLIFATYNLVSEEGNMQHYGGGRVVAKQRYDDPLGWGSEFLIDKKAGKPARIRFLLRDKAQKPITNATVDIVMTQPDSPSTPAVEGHLKMQEPGVYRGDVDMPTDGLWEAQVRVKQGANSWQVTQRLSIP